MKIGIISDTHDRLPPIQTALAVFIGQAAAVVHCGDWTKPATVEDISAVDCWFNHS
ncbi:metallophosphatase family protein [Candidatus Parcubacteria bacterium]|nr:metallophosphatase family protein [Candidatus Parcubacteria bacterium]